MNCPYCQTPLNVSEYIGERKYVCPHCMTYIDNPRLAPAQEAPNVLRNVRHRPRSFRWVVWAVWLLLGVCCVYCVILIIKIKIEPYPF